MPSSTSSFNRQIPHQPWGRMWCVSLVLAVVMVGALEVIYRRMGCRPNVTDDMALWSLHRNSVNRCKPRIPLVLLGASRIQLGLDLRELKAQYPHYHVVQLAISGSSPYATLRDLAEDERFRGVVICSITSNVFCQNFRDTQNSYVDYYHRHYNLNARVNTTISSFFQDRFVVLNSAMKADKLLFRWIKGRPLPSYLRTFADRGRLADYTLIDLKEHRQHRIEIVKAGLANTQTLTPQAWLNEVMDVESYVRQIQDRGGKVVFVRFPTTDEHWASSQQSQPKTQYWDVFARRTSATTVHFKDYPELSCFDCPDTSHLDQRDAPTFTRSLMKILENRYVIYPSHSEAEKEYVMNSPRRTW